MSTENWKAKKRDQDVESMWIAYHLGVVEADIE